MKSVIRKLKNKLYVKRNIDKYIEEHIESYLKNKLNFNKDETYKKIFKKGYHALMWDNALKNKEEKLIKYFDGNVKLYCYTDSFLSGLIYTDLFEEAELEFIRRYLKKGDIFVDIGANIGFFSMNAAMCIGDAGKVISFEPTPKTFIRLQENVKLNNLRNLRAFQMAVSEKDEQLEFTISMDGHDGWNSLTKPSSGTIVEKAKVDCIQIDSIKKIDPDFQNAALIKIDIEGWELFALKGGSQFLSQENAPSLLIEFTEQNAANAGTSCKEIYKYLNFLGYELYRFDEIEKKLILYPIESNYDYVNLIATKSFDQAMQRLKA